jgi:hypothetical protein
MFGCWLSHCIFNQGKLRNSAESGLRTPIVELSFAIIVWIATIPVRTVGILALKSPFTYKGTGKGVF